MIPYRSWHFEASADILLKLAKSQALHIIIIKYFNTGGSGNPPSLISALWNISSKVFSLLHKTKFSTLFFTRLYVLYYTYQYDRQES